jgi:hypothetical protein
MRASTPDADASLRSPAQDDHLTLDNYLKMKGYDTRPFD